MSILVASDIRKQYILGKQKVNALDGVDFIVEEGEFVAIMGPSGSGKSTLLHLLGGLDKPSQGEVHLANQRLSILNDTALTHIRRHHIGFVFQFYNLLPTLTAEENILLPLLIDGKDTRKYKDRLETLLALVNLSDRRHHKPDQLSGGEQQRVSIARALITTPKIVLADEPTGNLDSKTGHAIMGLLEKSCVELGQTIIMVTHDAQAATYAKRVVFLKDGKIVKQIIPQGIGTERLKEILEVIQSITD